jgi:serine/threonine protein phosphatase 1
LIRTYAIGDVHGHLDKLRAAHDLILADRMRCGDHDALVIHVGDLVDRGPQSAAVMEYMVTLHADDPRMVTLLGNHDRMLLQFVRDAREDPRLYTGLSYRHPRIGGDKTLLSYDVDPTGGMDEVVAEARSKIPAEHLEFIASRPLTLHRGGCFFVHAGVRPGVPLGAQAVEDFLWIREEFMDDPTDHGALVVHGHTPVGETPIHFGNHLALDTDAGHGGPLSVVVIEDQDVWLLSEDNKFLLSPANAHRLSVTGLLRQR